MNISVPKNMVCENFRFHQETRHGNLHENLHENLREQRHEHLREKLF